MSLTARPGAELHTDRLAKHTHEDTQPGPRPEQLARPPTCVTAPPQLARSTCYVLLTPFVLISSLSSHTSKNPQRHFSWEMLFKPNGLLLNCFEEQDSVA